MRTWIMMHCRRRLRMIVMASVILMWYSSNVVAPSHDGAPLHGDCMTCRMGEHMTHMEGLPSPSFDEIVMKEMEFLSEEDDRETEL